MKSPAALLSHFPSKVGMLPARAQDPKSNCPFESAPNTAPAFHGKPASASPDEIFLPAGSHAPRLPHLLSKFSARPADSSVRHQALFPPRTPGNPLPSNIHLPVPNRPYPHDVSETASHAPVHLHWSAAASPLYLCPAFLPETVPAFSIPETVSPAP